MGRRSARCNGAATGVMDPAKSMSNCDSKQTVVQRGSGRRRKQIRGTWLQGNEDRLWPVWGKWIHWRGGRWNVFNSPEETTDESNEGHAFRCAASVTGGNRDGDRCICRDYTWPQKYIVSPFPRTKHLSGSLRSPPRLEARQASPSAGEPDSRTTISATTFGRMV